MVLEILPPIASLAQGSAVCSRSLSDFCSLLAAACSPRDTITAFLEVLDNLMEDRWACETQAVCIGAHTVVLLFKMLD
jgi:hypothetical protein